MTASFRPRNAERRALLRALVAYDWVDTPGHGYAPVPDALLPGHAAWLRRQATYKFALSPPGNGIDCHRTWEMILVGVLPVMRKTAIDSVFGSLVDTGAVLLLDQWSDLNRTLLEDHWARFGEGLVRGYGKRIERADNPALGRYWTNEFAARSSALLYRRSRGVAAVAVNTADENVPARKVFANFGVHFRTYGNARYEGSKRRIIKEAEGTGWFNSAAAWGTDDLGPNFVQRYKDILALERGGGYWIWKLYLIKRWMEDLNEGDFLVYLDAGHHINKGEWA